MGTTIQFGYEFRLSDEEECGYYRFHHKMLQLHIFTHFTQHLKVSLSAVPEPIKLAEIEEVS